MKRLIATTLALAILTTQSGCELTVGTVVVVVVGGMVDGAIKHELAARDAPGVRYPRYGEPPPPPTEEIRAQLGRIGVSCTPDNSSHERADLGVAAVTKALERLKPCEPLRDRVVLVARRLTGRDVVVLGPSEKVDTLLEIVGPVVSLKYSSGINPPMRFEAEVTFRLLRANDRALLYSGSLSYDGSVHKLLEWSDRDAAAISEESVFAVQNLAERITEDLFLRHPLPSRRPILREEPK